MEIKAYWRILKRRWWLLLFGFAVVFGVTWILTSRQPSIYEASTTFVIRPRVSEGSMGDEFVRALDIVSRRVEINTTFAEVATSRLIANQAKDGLGLSPAEREGLKVSARVVGGTNVMEISAEGRDPGITRDFANAVGVETVNYVSKLYDVFELEPLDEAALPQKSSRPNVFMNLALGGVMGLALGACLVFLLQYLETATAEREAFNIIERETGAYTRSYLIHRLWGEASRARRGKHPLSLGLIRLEMDGDSNMNQARAHQEIMRLTKASVERALRDEDILSRFDSKTFVILMPDTSGQQAQNLLKKSVQHVSTMPNYISSSSRRDMPDVSTVLSVSTYDDFRVEPERFLDEAVRILGTNGSGYLVVERANGKARTVPNGKQSAEDEDDLLELVEADLVKN